MAEAELRDSMERAFDAYGKPLENVLAFKYLERVMTAGDDDWPAVVGTTPPQCAKKRADRKRRRMAEAELRDSTERTFEAYGKPLDTVLTFKYLGQVMTAVDDNWP